MYWFPRSLMMVAWLSLALSSQRCAQAEDLPFPAERLTIEAPIDVVQRDGISRFFDKQIAEVRDQRFARWIAYYQATKAAARAGDEAQHAREQLAQVGDFRARLRHMLGLPDLSPDASPPDLELVDLLD